MAPWEETQDLVYQREGRNFNTASGGKAILISKRCKRLSKDKAKETTGTMTDGITVIHHHSLGTSDHGLKSREGQVCWPLTLVPLKQPGLLAGLLLSY